MKARTPQKTQAADLRIVRSSPVRAETPLERQRGLLTQRWNRLGYCNNESAPHRLTVVGENKEV